MNWDAVAAVGEMVGALAVVISLVFVGIQVRQNTVVAGRSNARQTATDHQRSLENFLEETMADITLRGLEGLEGLTEIERYRFDIAISVWLEAIEQAFADSILGAFPKDLLVAYTNRLYILLDRPGGLAWWEQHQAWFSPSFRAEVERLRKQATPEGMKNAGIGEPYN
jgi:hypothetical protein